MKKRILSIILAIVMLACMIPLGTMTAFAESVSTYYSSLKGRTFIGEVNPEWLQGLSPEDDYRIVDHEENRIVGITGKFEFTDNAGTLTLTIKIESVGEFVGDFELNENGFNSALNSTVKCEYDETKGKPSSFLVSRSGWGINLSISDWDFELPVLNFINIEEISTHTHDFTKGGYVEYDKVNHKWAKQCECGAYDEANALTGVAVPTAVTGLVYNGEEQTGVAAGTGYTVTNGSATDAGDYKATATLADGYIWSDGTSDAKEIKWTIAKANATVTLYGFEYDNSDTIIYTVGEGGSYEFVAPEKTGFKFKGFELSDEIPYVDMDNETGILSIGEEVDCDFSVTAIYDEVVAVPTAVTGLVYNGEEQTGVEEGTGYILEDNTATDAGKYTATATLEEDYCWSDGSTDPVYINWSIAKKVVDVEWGTVSNAVYNPDYESLADYSEYNLIKPVYGDDDTNLILSWEEEYIGAGTYTLTADFNPHDTNQNNYELKEETKTHPFVVEDPLTMLIKQHLNDKTVDKGGLMGRQGLVESSVASETVGRTIIGLTEEQLNSIDDNLLVIGCDENGKEIKVEVDCAYTYFYDLQADGSCQKIEAKNFTSGGKQVVAFVIIEKDQSSETISGYGYFRLYNGSAETESNFITDVLYVPNKEN